jgi:hypothetical protein
MESFRATIKSRRQRDGFGDTGLTGGERSSILSISFGDFFASRGKPAGVASAGAGG